MKKQITGKVTSAKMEKTVVVQSETLRRHPVYGKYVRHRTRYYAHDEKKQARAGDKVLIEATRPLSKLKRWRVVKVFGND